ncbi:MAG: DUF1573 domain-containing protein [Saprospiraceae bacterium]|nr:DUF1573 domain-containing protein [Saprospiraceae bacterium]MCB9326168.1 DUF1573 domain-containing protein [Lewinellaceae bacterium]
MKKSLSPKKFRQFLITLMLLLPGLTSVGQVSVEWLTPMSHDFGDIKQGKSAFYEFKFRNTGNAPITLSNVRPSCGCTAPDWEETPILPDSISNIAIEFDARESGYFKKSIKVYFQEQRKGYKLYIEGVVEE